MESFGNKIEPKNENKEFSGKKSSKESGEERDFKKGRKNDNRIFGKEEKEIITQPENWKRH